jgi:hypothetical protein
MENDAGMQASLQPGANGSRRTGFARLAWAGLLLLSVPAFLAPQSTAGLAPPDIEAAYLYNFGKFVRWPAAPAAASSPFSICLLGEDGFSGTLDSLIRNETHEGRRIVTRRLVSAAAAGDCDIVFLGQQEEPRLSRDLAALDKRPVLTVSALPDFLDRGGMIQFMLQNNRVRFAVNLPTAEQAGLSLSSELLKVAVSVKTSQPQAGAGLEEKQ